MARILCTLALWIGIFLMPASAQQVPPEDGAAFERIIEEQLNAFQADDGAKAYGFAAPGIQKLFPSADSFMGMVRQSYPQVYRPRSYKFTGTRVDPLGRPAQTVLIIGPDGKAYTALYSMEKQADGTWKIAGCVILKQQGLDA